MDTEPPKRKSPLPPVLTLPDVAPVEVDPVSPDSQVLFLVLLLLVNVVLYLQLYMNGHPSRHKHRRRGGHTQEQRRAQTLSQGTLTARHRSPRVRVISFSQGNNTRNKKPMSKKFPWCKE